MNPILVTHCTTELDFAPRRPWPASLPAFAWRGKLLSAFERGPGPAVDLSSADFKDALLAVYPQLSFAEVARLAGRLSNVDPNAREAAFAAYGYRLNDRLEQIAAVYLQTPVPFQNFSADKGFAPRDLSPLLALPDVVLFAEPLGRLANSALSKSEATRALELGVELYLCGADLAEYELNKGGLTRMEAARRPVTAARDEERRARVAAWPWPAQTEGQWRRQGDETGLEIRLHARSPQDLNQKLARLSAIGQTWSSEI